MHGFVTLALSFMTAVTLPALVTRPAELVIGNLPYN